MNLAKLTDEDIIEYYNGAEDKAKALDNLAVTCRTDRAGMREKLRELGCLPEEPEPKKRYDHGRKIDPVEARRLYGDGMVDREIAAVFHCRTQTVQMWRKENGLPPNGTSCAVKKPKPVPEADDASPLREPFETTEQERGGCDAAELTTGCSELCDPCAEPKRESCDDCSNMPAHKELPLCDAAPEACVGCLAPCAFAIEKTTSPSNSRMEPREEPEEDAEPFTLGQLRQYIMQFLPAALNKAALSIDGEPVHEFYGFSVTQPGGIATVDLLTKRR